MKYKTLAVIDGLANEELNYWLHRSHTEEALTHIAEMLSEVATYEGKVTEECPLGADDYVVELDTELGNFILSFNLGDEPYAALTEIIDTHLAM